ncbi:phage holin family protein [Rugosimonospora acidiphila]|uniref:Phage holin family protein n=1 Tax=Rugosimonospora acidiphila TaxID=556531 RepID=A0ABP9RGV5_9ACTN
MGIVVRVLVTAVALWISTLLVSGIELGGSSTAKKVGTLIVVAAIFGVINGVLRPIIKTVGCAVYVLTFGLVALIVNGLLFMLTSWVAGQLSLPFHVDNFWPTAVLGALIVAVVSWLIDLAIPKRFQ